MLRATLGLRDDGGMRGSGGSDSLRRAKRGEWDGGIRVHEVMAIAVPEAVFPTRGQLHRSALLARC